MINLFFLLTSRNTKNESDVSFTREAVRLVDWFVWVLNQVFYDDPPTPRMTSLRGVGSSIGSTGVRPFILSPEQQLLHVITRKYFEFYISYTHWRWLRLGSLFLLFQYLFVFEPPRGGLGAGKYGGWSYQKRALLHINLRSPITTSVWLSPTTPIAGGPAPYPPGVRTLSRMAIKHAWATCLWFVVSCDPFVPITTDL